MALPDATWASGDLIPADWPIEIARGVASKADINLAGTGDYTLSATEYQQRFHNLSGLLTGNRNVITPGDGGRWWWVKNGTTGAFTVTYKTAAGTGIAIPQGGKLFVIDDGTNVTTLFFTGTTYTITNVTPDRSCDADTVAVAELADIVGTLIADLRTLGIIA
jgi:hypothetical protein